MEKYVLLTKVTISSGVPNSTENLIKINEEVSAKIKEQCPDIKWLENLAVLGPYDYLDIFEASGNESAFKAAAIVRSFGHARTEVWPVTSWDKFKTILGDQEKAHEDALVDEAGKESFPASDPPSFNTSAS